MQRTPWLGKTYFLVGIMLAAGIFAVPGFRGDLQLQSMFATNTEHTRKATLQQLDEDRIQALSIFRTRLQYLQTQVSSIDLAMRTAASADDRRQLRDSLQYVIQQEVDARKMLIRIQEADSSDWDSLKRQIALLLDQYDPTNP